MLNYFNSFQKSAFRVETLQEYNVDEEKDDYEYFLKHKKLPTWFWDWDDWDDIVQQAKMRWAIMPKGSYNTVPREFVCFLWNRSL